MLHSCGTLHSMDLVGLIYRQRSLINSGNNVLRLEVHYDIKIESRKLELVLNNYHARLDPSIITCHDTQPGHTTSRNKVNAQSSIQPSQHSLQLTHSHITPSSLDHQFTPSSAPHHHHIVPASSPQHVPSSSHEQLWSWRAYRPFLA